jgi:hypothetical protein
MSEEEFIIFIYCCIADLYDEILEQTAVVLRTRGYPPKLSDAEVITIEVVGEFLKIDTDKGIWEYFRKHYLYLFPTLGSRVNFIKQATNLWKIKQEILSRLSKKVHGQSDEIYITDGFPMPVCLFARARQSKIFRGVATYGHCATKKQTYYGFQGMITINSLGVISGYTVTPSNVDEREAVWETIENIEGLLIGDKGFISSLLKKELSKKKISLETSLRKNMKDTRDKKFVKKLVSIRRLVETVIGQLSERFNIEKIWARDLFHLTNRITRKILSHTLAIFTNHSLGRKSLQFEGIIAV